MTADDIFSNVDLVVDGWMGHTDCCVLYDYTHNLEKALIVEIGSYHGRSTKFMALSSPSSEIVAIDSNPEIKGIFLSNTSGLNITLINKTSKEANKTWNRKIDMLHIDGDHHYKAVMEDIKMWVPHVKSGGYILFHDCAVNEEKGPRGEVLRNPDYGVVRAIETLKDKYFKSVKMIAGFGVCQKI